MNNTINCPRENFMILLGMLLCFFHCSDKIYVMFKNYHVINLVSQNLSTRKLFTWAKGTKTYKNKSDKKTDN